MKKTAITFLSFCVCGVLQSNAQDASAQARVEGGSLIIPGKSGPGKGKHVVLLAGDDEYRSEEALPLLAKILAEKHGFDTTTCFSLDEKGDILPSAQTHTSDTSALTKADAVILFLRFRDWPDANFKHFETAYLAGKPIIALRTSTHAFKTKKPDWVKWNYNNDQGGFGDMVLGETWINHWGKHKKEGTRGLLEVGQEQHPLLRGVTDVFGDTDVYEAHPPADAKILMRGAITATLLPADPILKDDKRNQPMQPIVWTREHQNPAGKTNKIFTTTLGAATDFANEGIRRLLVNAVFWGIGLDIPEKADVSISPDYKPSKFGNPDYIKGLRPESFLEKK